MRLFFKGKNMDRAKKKIASAIDGLRNLHKPEFEYEFKEKITAEHLRLSMVSFSFVFFKFF